MTTLGPAMLPMPYASLSGGEASVPGRLVLWARRQIRYRRALQELRQLDDRDLDELQVVRADFPALAWRHALGAQPLRRPYR